MSPTCRRRDAAWLADGPTKRIPGRVTRFGKIGALAQKSVTRVQKIRVDSFGRIDDVRDIEFGSCTAN